MADRTLEIFAAGSRPKDDAVLPFRMAEAGAGGRIVRLSETVDQILSSHDYPESVSKLLGQAVTITALLGASLKIEGKFILQTKSDGPVDLLVADYRSDGGLRGYAHFDREEVERLEEAEQAASEMLLGKGHLAMTVDQGPDTERYQGIVELAGHDLNAAADVYFRNSEQLPTYVRTAVARHYQANGGNGSGSWSWRAGGLIVQQLAGEGGRATRESEPREPLADEEENWNRVNLLAGTVEDHELLDPELSSERLLYRLFHEESVRVYRPRDLTVYCQCSEKRIDGILRRFPAEDIEDMIEGDKIVVTCEFCSRQFSFDPSRFM